MCRPRRVRARSLSTPLLAKCLRCPPTWARRRNQVRKIREDGLCHCRIRSSLSRWERSSTPVIARSAARWRDGRLARPAGPRSPVLHRQGWIDNHSNHAVASDESGYFAAMKRRDFLRSSASLGAIVTTVGLSPATLGASEIPTCAPAPFPQTPGLTKYVVEFVRNTKFTDLPADVIELGKKSILDGLGLALAGARAQNGKLFREYAASLGLPDRGSTVMGTKNKLTPRFAAFANGLAIHVEDFDDTQLAVGKDRVYGLLTHPTVPVLPAALALCDTTATNAKDFLLAYHLGVEVECKIAEAISPRHYEDGFHSTGTCGVFGGATACAKLRAFDESHLSRALGIAAR